MRWEEIRCLFREKTHLDTDFAKTIGSNTKNGPGAQEMRSKMTSYKAAVTDQEISEDEVN